MPQYAGAKKNKRKRKKEEEEDEEKESKKEEEEENLINKSGYLTPISREGWLGKTSGVHKTSSILCLSSLPVPQARKVCKWVTQIKPATACL